MSSSPLFSDSVPQIDWSSIPTPPRFVHVPNDAISYFVIDHHKAPNVNGEIQHGDIEENHYQRVNKPKTLRCAAIGVPKPESVKSLALILQVFVVTPNLPHRVIDQ